MAHDGTEGLVVGSVEPQLVAQRDEPSVDHVSFGGATGKVVHPHRRLVFGIIAAKSVTYRNGSSNEKWTPVATPSWYASPVRTS